MKILKNKNGFTLVEVLVVVAIIGILAVVAAPKLIQNIEKAKITKLISDYDAFKKATFTNIKSSEITLNDLKSDIENDAQVRSLNTPIGGQYNLETIESKEGKYPDEEGNQLSAGTDIYWRVALSIDNKASMNDRQFKYLVKSIGNTNISIANSKLYLKIVE